MSGPVRRPPRRPARGLVRTGSPRPPVLRIRDYRSDDRAFLERGLAADLREILPLDPLRIVLPVRGWGKSYGRALRKTVRGSRGHLLIAEVGSRRAGFISGVGEETRGRRRPTLAAVRPAWIYDLYVAPAFRCRGVGAALLEAMEERFRADGRDFVHLLSLSGNEAARALYQRSGYSERVFMLGKWLVTRPQTRN